MDWLSIRKPLSAQDIRELEKTLQIALPPDYRILIGPINGGALRDAWVPVPELGPVPYARNVALNRDARASIFDLIDWFSCGELKLFPFASVGNGDYFCFDLSRNSVVLFRHETCSVVFVCTTFTELLGRIEARQNPPFQ